MFNITLRGNKINLSTRNSLTPEYQARYQTEGRAKRPM